MIKFPKKKQNISEEALIKFGTCFSIFTNS